MSILPEKLPSLPCFEFGARVVPARTVGGDFFGVIPLSIDKAAIFVGDVSDKGVPSAIFMARAHALLSAEAHRRTTPSQVLKRVNRLLAELASSPLFVTVLYGVIDCRNSQFTYARAGHELPLVADAVDGVRLVSWGEGQLLGVMDDPHIDEGQLAILAGGTLLLYTPPAVTIPRAIRSTRTRRRSEVRARTRAPEPWAGTGAGVSISVAIEASAEGGAVN